MWNNERENEFEGVEMAEYALQRKKERETQAACRHWRMRTRIIIGRTQDARKTKWEEGTCPDCGFHKKTIIWEEPVSEEATLR